MNAAGADAFLRDRFGDGVSDVEPIVGGAWSKAFAFRLDRAPLIARFGAFRDDFERDRLAGTYASAGLPIPAVIEIGEAFGGFYALSQRKFGVFIDQLDGVGMRATLPSLFAALDAARRVDLSAMTGYGTWNADGVGAFPSWEAYLLDVATDRPSDKGHGWRHRLEASATGAGRFDEALERMAALAPCSLPTRHLIHRDLIHFNVLVSGDRISAIFDWGCSLYGDFLYDLASIAFWSAWYPAWDGIDFRAETARHFERIGPAVPHFEERFRCCQIHAGLDAQQFQALVGDWENLELAAERTLAIATGER